MKSAVRLAVTAVLLLVVTACGFQGGSGGFVSGNGAITWLPVADRHPVGTVRGTTLQGKPFDLSSLHGKVVVINVWGSWCAPCRAEAPRLQQAYTELQAAYPGKVEFVGINTRDNSAENGLAFDRTFAITYDSLFDRTGESLLAFRGTITPSAIPSTIVLDTQGRIAASVIGEVTSSITLQDLVEDVITGKDRVS